MVTSIDFKKMLKVSKVKDVKLIILDNRFWINCLITLKVMGPVLRLLRICDSDEKPSIGYIYEGMNRVRKGIIELFCNKECHYKQYIDIIDARWDKMLCRSLHSAAYWLNPVFQYDEDNAQEKREAFAGVLDMIESKTSQKLDVEDDEHVLTFDDDDLDAL
ncbi:hypothetical protein E3N88_29154 [Mikania micrantha]|uniref:hAT-like transposase RNase-H fold domain-containing protein n=1 Tax=Mikania micrantha TaxID=192012 RepID=A0A5N6MHZ2_9ASTR|nr:hypothetical protein E3N88_29154 [Mikania micrantha]